MYFMNFCPLYEGLNNYFLTKRCNHERLKSIPRVHRATKVKFIIYMSLCPTNV